MKELLISPPNEKQKNFLIRKKGLLVTAVHEVAENPGH